MGMVGCIKGIIMIWEKMTYFDVMHIGASGNMSPTLILISGDIDFVNDLRAYQVRNGSTVILIYGTSTSCKFREGWNEVCWVKILKTLKK